MDLKWSAEGALASAEGWGAVDDMAISSSTACQHAVVHYCRTHQQLYIPGTLSATKLYLYFLQEPTRCSYVQVMLMAEHVSHLHSTASRAVRLHAVQELRKHSREVTNRATMGSLPSAMQQLVALLQDGDEQLREHAAGTLCNLCCSCEANKAKFGEHPVPAETPSCLCVIALNAWFTCLTITINKT